MFDSTFNAIYDKDLKLVEFLIENGDITIEYMNLYGINIASDNGDLDMLKLLLKLF